MEFLWSWLRDKPSQPTRVPTDTVIPLHTVDNQKMFTNIVMDLSLQFDHVLDADKLVGALTRLLEKPGWRKLGARIRRDESGRYEYHVPAAYTKERPAIDLSQTKYDISLAEHPIGSTLPRPNDTVQVTGDPKQYGSLFLSNNSPTTIDDWLYADRAQIVLHLVFFEDATLITFTWLHTFLDAISLHTLIDAWTAMLEGREQDIPEFYGEFEDPLATLGVTPDPKLSGEGFEEEDFILKDCVVAGWKFILFVFYMLWDLLIYRKEEIHYIIIPPTFFSGLRTEAMASLTAPFPDPKNAPPLTPNKTNPQTPFLSDGDILCAWWNRLITASLPRAPKPSRTIQILNVFNMQDVLRITEPPLLPADCAYVANCVTTVQSFFTLHELLSLPLGHVAARLRADLVLQTTRPQLEARWKLHREEEARSGYPPLYGSGDMQLSPFSNWQKAKVFEVDFGGAVVGTGREGEAARPVYVMPGATVRGMPLRMSGNLSGRDAQGNWWVGGILTAETWGNVRKAVEMLNAQVDVEAEAEARCV
ncbi:lysR family regulatory protein [Karstenula rhodostoma CBS 690.94]|uniref:LysR family regulatory protein n=1 Tax=Karstenula rhodostoma CBS 690.94 TaxID=1392251 RepID=A0A9P4PJJ5_9PLEO|nr:lysR family regulatory protein [Karstenula rhodostoma CBS 690.94]